MSKRYGRVLAAMVVGLTASQRPWRRAATRLRVVNALLQRHGIETPHGTLMLVTDDPRALEYPRELVSREPETIEWIDAFELPCVFWDIGANVGIYSLYAALRADVAVHAFEPAAASYAALCRNSEANGGRPNLDAYCIALGGTNQLGHLNMSATFAGSVYNAFESTMDQLGRPLSVVFRQAVVGYSVDGFRRQFDLAVPNYIKIDVDSIEEQILVGAAETLVAPALRSVLIELEDPPTLRSQRIIRTLTAAGFALSRQGMARGGGVNTIFDRAR
ncbi:MAG TPA: FkbM family methyltransferase [Stellaceae bacterium]|nr:FkbM family methyltransferase [Stellaceae bacterium]